MVASWVCGFCEAIFRCKGVDIGERNLLFYPLVIKHANGISPFSIGNASLTGPCSIAMLDYYS